MNSRGRFWCAVMAFYSALIGGGQIIIGDAGLAVIFFALTFGWLLARQIVFPTDKDKS